ncbi:MAG: hypothetical protein RIC55_04750 [Pirellulaceae bacterium]
MANLLALDWDGREARVAVARRRTTGVVLEQAFTVDLGSVADESMSAVEVGARLAAALSARQIGRCDTLVAVGRSRIELRALALPPSPVEELPDLVRFQALRQFANIGEDWPIDFVHLATGEEETLTVLTAAIAPEMVEQIRAACEAAEQSPKHLVLRPYAAASLLLRSMRDDNCRLMVDLLADEADLTVIADRQLVFMRTVRLPADDQRRPTVLMGEIRRTMVAAQNQLGGRAVERVVLCGNEQEHTDLKSRVEASLSLPVDVFDPFSAVEVAGELAANLPANPGSFTPLLGMLLDEAAGAAHAIDFLHPRKKPRPKSRKRTFALVGGAVAAVVLVAAGLAYSNYRSMDARIQELAQREEKLIEAEKTANQLIADASLLDAWNDGDVIWLDELRNLSKKYPPAQQAIITQLVAAGGQREGGGRYFIDCAAASPDAITDIERRLRDARREVQGTGGATDDNKLGYGWSFKKMVTIKPPTEEETAEQPSAADPSPSPASNTSPPPEASPKTDAGAAPGDPGDGADDSEEIGDAESDNAQSAGAQSAGAESGDAESAGAESAGEAKRDAENADAENGEGGVAEDRS